MIRNDGVGDIALQFSEDGSADLQIADDDIATDDGLHTAVLLSLFLDRRADDDEPLPGGDGDRRGWWADELASVEGDPIGSKLWLLDRAKRQPAIARRAETYAREALAWLLEDGIAERINVESKVNRAAHSLVVTIYRPQAEPARFHFSHAWEASLAL